MFVQEGQTFNKLICHQNFKKSKESVNFYIKLLNLTAKSKLQDD
jgi:hypothetical protein